MRSMKKLTGMICAIAVMLLCSVNMTYAWQNIGQTAVNISKGAPESIDGSDKDDQDKDDSDKDDSDKDDSEKEDSGKEELPGSTQKPSGNQPGSSFGTQNGKNDAKTGDTAEYLKYLVLMFSSFAAMIMIGSALMILLIHGIEKRRK